ncbi:hypothetical protein PVAND_014514 [Polypedilum vanderplanki]|uniref:Integrase catalytic domain-containing protein n=1 Tax=Polypedilum vanderplanki TaxID=319348 RepID=A0A9J6B9W0_POLVA|nr:hypothetical protein PVAND_014514 [Polypedilum vanderplanki]
MMHLIENPQDEHHKMCQDDCDETSGVMLKCMNARGKSNVPCKNIIHAKCVGVEENMARLFSNYYCTDCTTSDEELHQEMDAIEAKAKFEYEDSQNKNKHVSIQEYEKLKNYATKLSEELRIKTEVANANASTNAQMQVKIDSLSVENKALKERLTMLENKQSHAPTKKINPHDINNLSPTSLFRHFDDTLHHAEGAHDLGDRTQEASKFHSTTFSAPSNNQNNKWPDYDKQTSEAAIQNESSLLLVRASLAKPQQFTGDVTKWPTFLSEFVRTSARGFYRDYEDIDRLRELIQGEAREMFVAELSDPCAETLPTLKRLDDFFGVKGNAVRISLDRITQMSKIEKQYHKDSLVKLYTNLKSYILQCRVHKSEHELESQATLFIVESKMCNEHVMSWRSWVKLNQKGENVHGVVAFLEDQIRDLNLRSKPTKPNIKASVHATTQVTGGQTQDSPPVQHRDGPNSSNKSEHRRGNRNSRGRGRGRGRGGKKDYSDYPCFHCKEKHPFFDCPQFLNEEVAKRIEIVNKLHICTRCLCNDRHKADNCYNRMPRCYVNGCDIKNTHPKLHNHPNKVSGTQSFNHIDVPITKQISHFAMVPGHVVGKNGNKIPTTIMYDTGSGISLTTENLFKEANYESYEEYELTLHWATSVTHQESHAKCFDLYFIPQGQEKVVKLEKLTAVSELDLPMQSQNALELKKIYPHLNKIPIPSYEKQKPQILLGLPHASFMSSLTTVLGKKNDPIATFTRLGWTLYGNKRSTPLCRPIVDSKFVNFACCETPETELSNNDLLKYIQHYNSLENIGISHKDASVMSADDQKAEKMIATTMKFHHDKKRYEVGLLWAKENDSMPDNYDEAVIRLKSTEKRLIKLNMVEFVHKQFEQQIADGLLVEVTREEAEKYPRRNYVYGFLTFNKNKSPPKPRWVNDTAARFKGVSLNAKLLKGPDSLVPLPLAMCALREGKYAFQADVKSMFNQVLLKEEDQFSQLTLWRNCDTNITPRIYRQTRVIFGPTCSPAITSAIRVKHAKACAAEFPEAANVAENQMYVDDAPESCDTVEEAVKVANDLITIFNRISWPLIEFQSNSQDFLERLPPENVSKKSAEIVSNDGDEYITKVLGIFWKPKPDVYVFRVNDDTIIKKCVENNYMPTKREMLGTVMKFFDPTGMISPFRIRGQMIMQKVWKAGTDWKKRPPKDICDEFITWLKEFDIVTRLEIPRPYAHVSLKQSKLSLHVFVDAGAEAYAAAVYIRIENSSKIVVRLVASKARVAPVKYVSIPRLELMSALLGARLFTSVKKWHRRLNLEEYMCWVDSDVVFKWIRSPHLPRTTFTAPRITEIQELTSADRWFHVPSEKNVADFATKNRQFNYSDANHEWYNGPEFLYRPKSEWPKQVESVSFPIEVISLFVKPLVSAKPLLAGVMRQISAKIRGNWLSHVNVVAIALRFVDYSSCHNQKDYDKRRHGYITGDEFQRAENYIFGLVQRAVYPAEYECLRVGKNVSPTSPIASLSPIYCAKTNLIRATTRLSNSFPFNMRSPPILPNFNEVTDSIIAHYHKLHLHVGDNAIISSLRSRVWILNARRAVRRSRARCLQCIERKRQIKIPVIADLPDFRFDVDKKAFFHTGIDLFGPFEIYVGESYTKKEIHVVIFTCMVTRAVYLETLEDQSTKTFMLALNRLWTRRGPIAHVYSDNGRNFTGAANKLNEDEFQKWLTEKKIQWHFIPAFTPQFGGTWERLIKDIKRGLKSSIEKFTVRRHTFELVLSRIELNLNNRPLTELPVSTNDDAPITPYLLMTGHPNYPICNEDAGKALNEDVNLSKMKIERRVNSLVQAFRSRFVKEYAPIIARRSSNAKMAKNAIKLNDFVIYMDPTKNPSLWKRGFVIKTYPGKDKNNRVVDVKTTGGEILPRRSIYRLAKLDLYLESEAAEQNKYSAALNLLREVGLKIKTDTSPKSCAPQKLMEKHSNSRIFDDSTKIEPEPTRQHDRGSAQLTESELNEFVDQDGTRSIYVKNLPAEMGIAEIFTVMSEFGSIKGIIVTKWDGLHPFNCHVCYSEQASVDSALLFNESQLIIIDGEAYRQQFEKLQKVLKIYRVLRKPFYQFVTVVTEFGQRCRLLTITEGKERENNFRIPYTGNIAGFINYCPRTHKYDFERRHVDMSCGPSAIRDIPYIFKSTEQRLNVVTTSSSNINAQRHHRVVYNSDDTLVVQATTEDPFHNVRTNNIVGANDLRRLIERRRQARNTRSVIVRPNKRRHV